MTGRFPDHLLEDILSRVDIAQIISGYLPLKRAGRNFKACCPFHQEKTASFMVSPEKQIYHCFGCGESGNAFKFLMRYERMDFPEAVRAVAQKAGVVLPEPSREDAQAAGISAQIFKLNALAADFYAGILHAGRGRAAKEYLLKRGLKEETLKAARLGFAPEGWDNLINFLRAKGAGLSLLEKAGLIAAKEGGGFYDRFRNRIIIPTIDIKERVAGFGARVLDNSLPKYINSPETPVYAKGRILYGFNLAREAIRQEDLAVVVEGYLDFIIPYQEGLKNIVASQGTALTPEQARQLKRYTDNVVVVYDADAAGEIASLRSLDIFLEEEMSVKVASLPKGYDPDSFVRGQGVAQFKERVAQARGLFEYKLSALKSRFNWRESEGKAEICTLMLETLDKVKNAVLKSEYIKRLAQELDVREDALFAEAKKAGARHSPARGADAPAAAHRQASDVHPAEKLLVKLMLEENALLRRVKESVAPADFCDERMSRIAAVMFELSEQGKELRPGMLMQRFGDEGIEQALCESAFLPGEMSAEHKEKVVDDCIRRLKSQKARLERQRLHEEIKGAQASGDEEALSRLMRQFQSLFQKE
jgi:DNA primase